MKVDIRTEHQILATIQSFFAAYANRDLPGVMALFIPDPDVVLIGTESDERLVGLDSISQRFQSDWSSTDELSMELRWHSVSGKDMVCWLAAEIMVTISAEGNRLEIPARISVVLEHRQKKWLISHWHASISVQ